MSYTLLPINTGDGTGGDLAGDTFTQGANTVTIVFGGLAFGTLGAGAAYQTVDSTHGLPVQVLNAGFQVVGTVTVVDSVDLNVNVTNASLAVTQSGVWSLADHQSTNVDQWNGNAVDTNSGNKSAGTLRVVIATDQPALTNNQGFFTPAPAGQTVGATPFKLTAAAASTNATSLKASAGTLWEVVALNVSASAVAYLKLYDKASAPTVGSDTPVYVAPIPTAGSTNGAGVRLTFPVGLKFANGIAYAITGGMGDGDATAIAANQVMLSGSYV